MMENKKCIKCGSEDIHTDWHENEHDCSFDDRMNRKIFSINEHLHYHCRNCSFAWVWKTQDANTQA